MNYFESLTDAMDECAKHPKSVFIGQGVGYAGTSMTDSLCNVPSDQLLEFPVAEDLQMGFAIGLALDGWLPICIFPRWNFLLCAANQLINHLDRIPLYSAGKCKPKIIIRTCAPSTEPFDPGPQHNDDFSEPFRRMFRTIVVNRLFHTWDIKLGYQQAMESEGSTLLVEYASEYKTRTPSGVMP